MQHFNLQITLRVTAIAITSLAGAFILNEGYFYTCSAIFIMLFIQVLLLIQYTNKTNKQISQFLEDVKHNDFSSNFSIKGMGSSFEELGETFQSVINDFTNIRAQKEEQYILLQNIIQQLNSGIAVYNEKGVIVISNNTFKHLFKLTPNEDYKQTVSQSPELSNIVKQLSNSDKYLFKRTLNNDILQLAIYKSQLILKEENLTLLTIYNIQPELEDHEIETWQKLIRVLTHEIMNSITPISSLSTTLQHLLATPQTIHDNIKDINLAIESIQRRSVGLSGFVDQYRSLTRLPKPDFKIIPVSKVISRVQTLVHEKYKSTHTSVSIAPEHLEVVADETQLEQVLINLLTNAYQAVSSVEKPHIHLNCFADINGKVIIQIENNGAEILPEVIDKIFIPFFTTKPNGSGIGLSLSRQIMRLHGGSIQVQSSEEKTVFSLHFK